MTLNGSGLLTAMYKAPACQTRLPTASNDFDQEAIRRETGTLSAGFPLEEYALPLRRTSHLGFRGAKSLSYNGADNPGSPVNTSTSTNGTCSFTSLASSPCWGIVKVPLSTTTNNCRPSGCIPGAKLACILVALRSSIAVPITQMAN